MNTKYNNRVSIVASVLDKDKEYLSNMGQKWRDEEEKLLLEELDNNIDIERIALKHKRTIGAINARRRLIACKMYLKNISIEEIIRQTKLDNYSIQEIINKKNNSRKIKTKKIDEVNIDKKDYIELQNDVKNMKNDIKHIKNTLRELVKILKADYEFEDT